MTTYIPGQELAEDEYLLKLRYEYGYSYGNNKYFRNGTITGFLSKLTQKGELPVKFRKWKPIYEDHKEGDIDYRNIYVFKEFPRSGWSYVNYRHGESQSWIVMRHPEGFNVEIYLSNFLDLIKNSQIVNGQLEGQYYWKNHKLIPV